MPEERLTRGSVINAWLNFVKKKWGQDALDQVLKELDLPGMLKAGKFYDDEYYYKTQMWIKHNKGEKYLVEGGKFLVHNLGLLAWIVRFASTYTVMERAVKNSNEIYKFGRAELETPAEHIILVKLKDICYFPERCLSWKGVIEGTLEVTRTKGTVEEITCQNKGGDQCVFKVRMEG